MTCMGKHDCFNRLKVRGEHVSGGRHDRTASFGAVALISSDGNKEELSG